MAQMILKYDQKLKHYWPDKEIKGRIPYLAFFLIDDVGCSGIQAWKEFINDPKQLDANGEYAYLEKNGNKINLYMTYYYFKGQTQETLELTVEQLNYILDRWQEALEKKPNKIIITKDDNNEITVEFEN